MDLSLSPDLEAYVASQVRSGAFSSADEVVADALRRKVREDDITDLREKLRRSEEDIKGGRTVAADDVFFEAKRQRIRERHARPLRRRSRRGP